MPVLHLKKRAIVPASGPAQPPSVPVAITFAPASPIILDNAPNGTLVATISVTMSPVALFTGVLSFAAPFNNDGGLFTIAGSNLIVAATLPAGNSTQNITVSATQNGVTMTQSLAIQVQQHSTGTGATLTTFQLTSPNSGLQPFTIGIALKKGATLGPISLDQTNTQVIIKRTWNDGSVKHAIASGFANLVANTPLMVKVLDQGGSSGAALTSSDIAAANPSATVSLGALGFVPLSLLLASAPVRTFLSGPQMVECHYQAVVSNMLVSFHVRLYLGGRLWIRACVDNGWVDVANSSKTYSPTITVGSTVVYSPGSITHFANTRYVAEGWIGGDPQITPTHSTTDLIATKLVPNYFMDMPSAATLSGLTQTYTPFGHGDIAPDQTNTGPQNQIGLLPWWDSLFITSLADSRAYNSVIANAKAINSYSIVWRGNSDGNLPCRPSIYPNYTFFGPNQGGGLPPAAGTLTWDQAHHGSAGYLAYLLTGDYFHLETMQLQSASGYLSVTWNDGYPGGTGVGGTSRSLFAVEPRAVAWINRTIGQYCAIAPSDSVLMDYQALLATQANNAVAVTQLAGVNQLGIIYDYGLFLGAGTDVSSISLFMQWFLVQAFGYVSDIEPLSGMTNWNAARDWLYKIPTQLLGDGTGTTFCYSQAAAYFDYNFGNGSPITSITDAHYPPNWNTVWSQTVADPLDNTNGYTLSCGATLLGTSGSNPVTGATSFWANLMPAIALAVDHGATNAAAGWNRLTGAANWLTLRNAVDSASSSSFADFPNFGITPRDKFVSQLGLLASGQWSSDLVTAAGGRHYTDAPFVALGAANFNAYYGHNGHVPTASSGNPWAFSSGCLLPDKNKYAFTAGGHSDWLGTEIQLFDFPTLSWQFTDDSCQYDSVADPSAIFTLSGTPTEFPWPNKSGRRTPIASHMYGGMAYCQSLGLIEVLGTFRYPDAAGGQGGAAYITSSGQWESPATHASPFTTISQNFAIWIPDCKPAGGGAPVGRVFRMGNQGGSNPIAYLHDPVTGTWEQAGQFVSAFPRDNFIGSGCLIPDPLNPGFRAYIAIANTSPTTQCFLAQKVDVTGTNPNLGFVYRAYGNTAPALSDEVAFVPMRNDRGTSQIVVWDATSPLQFYILDDTTLMWTGPFSLTGVAPDTTGEGGGNNVYKKFHYHPTYDAFCFFSGATKGDLFAFKRPSQVL